MQETGVQSLGQKELLEMEMATHFSILAWEIPWTGDPGRLQSMQLQKSQVRVIDLTTAWIHKRVLFHHSKKSGDKEYWHLSSG